jgi:hypothetical protein
MPKRQTPVHVDVRDGQLVLTQERRVDLIGHVFDRANDTNMLREMATRIDSVERGGA